MKILKCYKKCWRTWGILITCLLSHSIITSTQEPAHFSARQVKQSKQFYLAGPLYDGANTVGYFWPQILSGYSNHAVWADVGLYGTFGGGMGYRYLFKSHLFKQLCFGGLYGYCEWPNWVINPYGTSVMAIKMLTESLKYSRAKNLLWATVSYTRWNVALEMGTPYVNITLNGYGFMNPGELLKSFIIHKEKRGVSLRFAYHDISIKPFFVVLGSYVQEVNTMTSQVEARWLISWAAGSRYQISNTIGFEIKYVHDFGKQYHLPVHCGFHYNPSAHLHRSTALPSGYNTLPERFIPHYQNADIKRILNGED